MRDTTMSRRGFLRSSAAALGLAGIASAGLAGCGSSAASDGGELNIEGDPRPDLLALVHEVRAHQLTLVPVRPGEVTSEAGWPAETPRNETWLWPGPRF